MEFSLSITAAGSTPVIELKGPLMDSEVYRFSRELKRLAKEGHPVIAVDVTHCEFMDSHALGLLVFNHNELQKQKRGIVIINENEDPAAYMTGLLETTGLNQLFAVTDRARLSAGNVG
jgi:anti-anti-sigma factor